LRLKFFREIQERHEYQALALGHTADDQMELLFLRLLRGAGPEGIKGMWPSDGRGTIRPLLGTSKAQIVHWLKSEGLPFRFDDSNLSRCYRRNQLRLDLLPQLLAYNPRLGEAVTRFQTLLQEQEDFFHQEAARLLSDMRINSGDGSMRLPLAKLLALHPSLQRRVLRLACAQVGVPVETLTFRHLEAALRLCRRLQPAGQISLPGGWRLVRENQQFFWQPRPISLPSFPECLLPDQESGSYTAAGWTFTWTTMPTAGRKELDFNLPHTALMDYHQLHFPLRLRCVRAGDRFRPLGMTGVKKLQDFFVDAKIPRSQRSSIPLLVSGDQIVWVVGHRLADTVKVSDDTRKLFKLEAWLSSPEKISRSNKLPRFDSDVRNDDPSA
jgi:tRNA(Ile)-lysidine synthase